MVGFDERGCVVSLPDNVLLDRKVGGVSGGGSKLTEEARRFMRRYEAFRQEYRETLLRIYDKHFPPE
jgi:molybdate transport system regulatory protein